MLSSHKENIEMTQRVQNDVFYEGKLIAKAGDEMTAEDAHQLYTRYEVEIKFTCRECNAPLTNVNICDKKIKAPHFKKHKIGCSMRSKYEKSKTKEKRGEVNEKEIFYSKLINPLDNKKSYCKSEITEDDELLNENFEKHNKERKTTKEVKDICTQYLKLINEVKNKNFEEQKEALKKIELFLPHAKKNYTYAHGFWNANGVRENTGYKIFHGILGRWISCVDGDVFFYKLPTKFNQSWMPMIVKIPKDLCDESYKLNWKNNEYLKTHARIFVYGYPQHHSDGAFVVNLEHISFIYMADYTRKDLSPLLQIEQDCDETIKMMIPKAHAQFNKLNLNTKTQNIIPIDKIHSSAEDKSDIISNKIEIKNEVNPEIKKIKASVLPKKTIQERGAEYKPIISGKKPFFKKQSIIAKLINFIFF